MIAPLDETCPPNTQVVDDSVKKSPVAEDGYEVLAAVADEGTIVAPVIMPSFADEDCPGSRTGDGCE